MRFYSADALTGRIVGQLEPVTWEFTEPLTGQTQVTMHLPLPDTRRDAFRGRLQRLTRQLAIYDETSGRVLAAGPIPAPPARGDDGLVQVSCVDWRGWWNRALIWPNGDGSRRDYFATDVEQMTILSTLAAIGLDHPAAPQNMAVDTPAASGVTRTQTFRMFTTIGSCFDAISRAESGPDWWTYSELDGRTLVPHTAFAYPYRALRGTRPILVRSVLGEQSNAWGLSWPAGQDRSNVVYGIGSSAPPDQGWAVAEHQNVTSPVEVVWPEVMSLPSGVITATQAFESTLARLDAVSTDDGTVTLTIDAEQPRVADYAPGDTARVVVEDGWRSLDVPTARVLSRTVRGTGPNVSEVTLTLDLSFDPTDVAAPGEAGEEV